jgi:hypothetical protein
MKHSTQHLKGIAAFIVAVALAATTIPLSKSTQAQAGSAPVTVVNTPLPVSLTGTGKIAGDVNAAQRGEWNVGVTSLPAVQLAPGASVGINGGFTNTATTPIFVRDVDEPSRNAYVVYLCQSTESPCGGATVPVGTRYVIEQISGECNVGSGSSLYGWKLTARLNDVDNAYHIRENISAPDGSGETTRGFFFQETRIYADGGVANGLSAQLVDVGGEHKSAACSIYLSGHLVAMP